MWFVIAFVFVLACLAYYFYKKACDDGIDRTGRNGNATAHFSEDNYNRMMTQVIKWYKKEEYCPYDIQSVSIGFYSDKNFSSKIWLSIWIVTHEDKEILLLGDKSVVENIKNEDWKQRNKAKVDFFNIFTDIYDTRCESVPFADATTQSEYEKLKKAVRKYNQEHFPNVEINV